MWNSHHPWKKFSARLQQREYMYIYRGKKYYLYKLTTNLKVHTLMTCYNSSGRFIVILFNPSQILRSSTLMETRQCTCFLYRLVDDKIAPYSTLNIIKCRMYHIFVIKQLVQKISALIKSISKWLTVKFAIEWTKWLWIDPYSTMK